MNLQYIVDSQGKPTGVYIPIEEWEELAKKYQLKENLEPFELSDLQKKILDNQDNLDLSEYQDHDAFVADVKKDYGL